jgi:hypothetical protein
MYCFPISLTVSHVKPHAKSRLTTKAEPRRPNRQPRMRTCCVHRRRLRRIVRQQEISICHFAPDVSPRGNRIVGAAVGFGGKVILTVSFRLRLSESSSEPAPITVPRGGRGGFIEPELAGFGAGFSSSFGIDAQCCLTTKAEPRRRDRQPRMRNRKLDRRRLRRLVRRLAHRI